MTIPAREIPEGERLSPLHYAAVRPDGLSFMLCVREAAGTLELVSQVDRLYGTAIVARKTPIDRMIDEATGKHDADMQTFLRFVWNFVFCALRSSPPDAWLIAHVRFL